MDVCTSDTCVYNIQTHEKVFVFFRADGNYLGEIRFSREKIYYTEECLMI